MHFFYRLRQLWHNVIAQPLTQKELEQITDSLHPRELTLFRRMSDADQQHAYRVYGLLMSEGESDRDLLAAALLHDVGKVQVDLSAWDRTVAVLGESLLPGRVTAWGENEEQRWQRPFTVRSQHAAWGAALAQEAGSQPGVVDLISRHQDHQPSSGGPADERLALLQWADNQS